MPKGIDTSALIASFAARGGTIKQVESGARTLSEKQLWEARYTPGRVSAEQAAINERRYVVGSDGVEHCRNGLGEWIY